MSLKASISGIRGIVGESLTPEVITSYVTAFSSMMPEGTILVGRDSRPSGESLTTFVTSLLNLLGRDVVDVGIVPTPTVLFCVREKGFAGGIVITASHNPIEWNALKLVNSKGKFLSPAEFGQLANSVRTGSVGNYATWDKIGTTTEEYSMSELHITKVLGFVDVDKIKACKFKVAIDTVNGAAGPMGASLLRRLGCEVVELNTATTGYFAHPPEPTPENLSQLSVEMKRTQVDVGFALDPDGDRLVLAVAGGRVLSEEYTLALGVEHYLRSKGKSDVAINLSSSRLSVDVAQRHSVRVYKVPTGEIHVTEALESLGAKVGGEGNGGIIVPEINACRDALVGMAMVLEAIAITGRTLEELATQLGEYSLIKKKFDADVDLVVVEERLRENFPDAEFDTTDGIRVDFAKSWILIRKSNTEPIVRVFAESESIEESESLTVKAKELAGL